MASASCFGLKVAIDVQHLYRPSRPSDRGTVFQLEGGTTVAEADIATGYAAAAAEYLRGAGAEVLVNDPARRQLVGYYSQRNREATRWGAHCYLACHVNAGRGSYCLMEYMDQATAVGSRTGRIAAARLANWIGSMLVQLGGILSHRNNVLVHGDRGAVCIEGCGESVAAVLVEPFFGDNPREQELATGRGVSLVGEWIGQGVASWWGAGHGVT